MTGCEYFIGACNHQPFSFSPNISEIRLANYELLSGLDILLPKVAQLLPNCYPRLANVAQLLPKVTQLLHNCYPIMLHLLPNCCPSTQCQHGSRDWFSSSGKDWLNRKRTNIHSSNKQQVYKSFYIHTVSFHCHNYGSFFSSFFKWLDDFTNSD